MRGNFSELVISIEPHNLRFVRVVFEEKKFQGTVKNLTFPRTIIFSLKTIGRLCHCRRASYKPFFRLSRVFFEKNVYVDPYFFRKIPCSNNIHIYIFEGCTQGGQGEKRPKHYAGTRGVSDNSISTTCSKIGRVIFALKWLKFPKRKKTQSNPIKFSSNLFILNKN